MRADIQLTQSDIETVRQYGINPPPEFINPYKWSFQ